jgi:hypothetical protein
VTESSKVAVTTIQLAIMAVKTAEDKQEAIQILETWLGDFKKSINYSKETNI